MVPCRVSILKQNLLNREHVLTISILPEASQSWLHFFVCKDPRKSNWLGVLRNHREFGEKGLQILAITADDAGKVSSLLHTFALPFPVGAASGLCSPADDERVRNLAILSFASFLLLGGGGGVEKPKFQFC